MYSTKIENLYRQLDKQLRIFESADSHEFCIPREISEANTALQIAKTIERHYHGIGYESARKTSSSDGSRAELHLACDKNSLVFTLTDIASKGIRISAEKLNTK